MPFRSRCAKPKRPDVFELNMSQLDIQFEKVSASAEQIDILFDLLNKRSHRISHKDASYSDHEKFVETHPYRVWFLVKLADECIGSFYITNENTIGINVSEERVASVVKPIIEFVESNYQPLAAVPSIRGDRFAVNVPPSNTALAHALDDIGADIAQITYWLPR